MVRAGVELLEPLVMAGVDVESEETTFNFLIRPPEPVTLWGADASR